MKKSLLLVCTVFLLSGCPHHRSGLVPKNPSPEELAIGAILFSGIVALEIADEIVKEKKSCENQQDCPDGYYCNYSKQNCDKY